ncbi:MAG: bifunctional DNA-formamidopyrimidine glycosylase/DNA-(apurinic or apyrimidinic site) lyase [Limnochordaceae bacterium]|nr:bifunctional DNA-formamidopyrimidine glycosylase/DNA-(apurinic or apyrimidinic site) lyase [Limnochordaceae bacterium]
MPELPEVETIRRTLASRIAGRTIQTVEVYEPRLVQDMPAGSRTLPRDECRERPEGRDEGGGLSRGGDENGWPRGDREGYESLSGAEHDHDRQSEDPDEGGRSPQNEDVARVWSEHLTRVLAGKRLAEPGRRGKYLLLPVEGGPWQLVVHLRMTGQLLVLSESEWVQKPSHRSLLIRLDQGLVCGLFDVRKFARLYLVRAGDPDSYPAGLRRLGPEPMEPEWTLAGWRRALAGRRTPIKSLLLNQEVVAGVGNIYADEALWRARVHPAWPAGMLNPQQAQAVRRAVRRVLREGLAAGGTTIRDYVAADGSQGDYAAQLHVYGRTGQPCSRCGTPIACIQLAGRSAHFCPRCQPAAWDTAGGAMEAAAGAEVASPEDASPEDGKADRMPADGMTEVAGWR